MSHLHERKEKVCLNCGTALTGRYCPNCGQENVEPRESFWHLLSHFFEDVTHFDGKLFATLKPLLLRPGFLTREYLNGRRAAYLNPIRMYLFISALFFLLLMSSFSGEKPTPQKVNRALIHNMRVALDSLAAQDNNDPDTALRLSNGKINDDYLPKTVAEYDSIQKTLPAKDRDGWVTQYFKTRTIRLSAYNKDHPGEMRSRFKEHFFHLFPYMLFLTLPLIALLLELLYVRRKSFYYVSHMIFTLHFYCFVFLLLIICFGVKQCGHIGVITSRILVLAYFVYLFIAMKRFYAQGFGKTLIKFLLLFFIGGTVLSFVTALFVIYSAFSIAS